MSRSLPVSRWVVVIVAIVAVSGVAVGATLLTAGGGGSYETPSGLTVTAGEDHDLDRSNPFAGTDTVSIANVSVTASGGNVTIDDFEGTTTNTSAIDAPSTISINPGDKARVNVSGGINSIDFVDTQADDGSFDFAYSASSSATAEVATGVANSDVFAVSSSRSIIDNATTDNSGRAAFSLSSGGNDVTIQTSDAPTLSSPSPADGAEESEINTTLAIDVTDGDFDSTDESVMVEFYGDDGTLVGSETVTTNSTASTSYTATPGTNTWRVEATGEDGGTVTASYSFGAPAELEVRDELDPDQLITANNATIEFYPRGDLDTIVTRNATNGTVDMTGLPSDQPFVAVVEADGYETRRVFIRSFAESQRVYLLPTSANSVGVEFELEDFSGQYPDAETVLIVERELNESWQTVQGDFFGATGRWDAVLQQDQRHRLSLLNVESGASKPLGPYTPQISGVQTVRVEQQGSVTLSETTEQILPNPALGSIEAGPNAEFGVEIREGDQTITNYQITVEHVDPDGNTNTLAVRNGSGSGIESFTLNLTAKNGSVQGNVDYNTSDGAGGLVTISREIRGYYPAANGLLGGLLDIGSGLGVSPSSGPTGTSTMVAFLLSLLATVGAAYGVGGSPETLGLASLGSLVFFQIIGWIGANVLFAATATFGAMILMRQRL